MSSTALAAPSRQAKAIALMTVTAFVIQIVDGLAKYLSADYSPLFIGWARYAVAFLILLPCAAALHGPRLFPSERLVSHVLRTIFLVTAMSLYFVAIARIPLATAISAFFIAPVLAVVLSILVLRERMTLRKGISLALGFAGAMVILQPGHTIEPGILLALGAGFAFALYMVATRHAATHSDPVKTLAFQCAAGALLLTPQAVATWSTPALSDLIFFAGLGAFSLIGHLLSIVAFRLADTSTLAPLVYVELIGATLIGYLGFGDVPGMATIVGAVLIAAAGLILLQRRNGGTTG
ncbi:DMT family transporter [Mesorhizobium sp. BAC0120]|uniref:DMT family transporter n=1 Tax=Mesorhizobium sp. BAC0120 TaxID=3090670 RepID=UPI00298CE88D|nr:DMT family transporter [Mesorhizobium sp. BAC0120]MDW6021777.1 DMT family transporter [Mesorhizobium sp. BAC0120]